MKWVVLAAILFLALPSSNAVMFNEIMYNIIGSDDNVEWMEILNEDNTSVDMQGWKLFEEGTNHNIVAVLGDYILDPHELAVIADNPSAFLANNTNFTGTLFDSTFSLSNTGETLVLKNKTGQIQENVTYSYLQGGNENGYSVGLYHNVWRETFPTPGKANRISGICDWKVSILLNKIIFEDKTDASWKVKTERLLGEPHTFVLVKRSVEDIYGKSIKVYSDINHNISNSETLSYEPNLNPGTYLLKAEIVPNCDDENQGNNVVQELVAVKGTTAVQNKDSSVELVKIYDLGKDNEAQFGQIFKVSVKAYRGDTQKQTLSLWVEGKEKISKVFDFKIVNKYSEQELTIPVQILPNCKNKLKNGTYKIVLEGLGQSDTKEIQIYGNLKDSCIKEEVEKEAKTETKTVKESAQNDYSQTNVFEPSKSAFNSAKPFAVSTVMFESSQGKSEKLVPYIFVLAMSVTAVFLILFNKGIL